MFTFSFLSIRGGTLVMTICCHHGAVPEWEIKQPHATCMCQLDFSQKGETIMSSLSDKIAEARRQEEESARVQQARAEHRVGRVVASQVLLGVGAHPHLDEAEAGRVAHEKGGVGEGEKGGERACGIILTLSPAHALRLSPQ